MNKVIYSVIIALSLVTGALAYGQNATNATDINMTSTTTKEIIPDPTVEGEKEPIKSNDIEWIPMAVDWWDDEGLHGETIWYNPVTGETRKEPPKPEPFESPGLVPEEDDTDTATDNDSGNQDNGNEDNADNDQPEDPEESDNGNSDNGDSEESGEPFD
jgi:hypothetical protein